MYGLRNTSAGETTSASSPSPQKRTIRRNSSPKMRLGHKGVSLICDQSVPNIEKGHTISGMQLVPVPERLNWGLPPSPFQRLCLHFMSRSLTPQTFERDGACLTRDTGSHWRNSKAGVGRAIQPSFPGQHALPKGRGCRFVGIFKKCMRDSYFQLPRGAAKMAALDL
jgi:hypothetical protein